ncbi:ZYRO0F11374p [Zygosaccharomyces rouxii]|uniref:DNA damage-binding protein CMR1 n=1 Tax=Zygosaccharomyces rouxii (strain ATCC 2623 / CBS 732 / NBRC 1130 / NCYC 568 / NRRL Y-229) TaxID=559307 RepID=C5DY99_ZYGRC|nr:uncharacterized protein ZYRO0F11374g [Zygosaccharomyces rouxii]KAH9199518.1 WD40-repeat-containing domain protein [Zygosaccharomyces rouxii]CAR28760.1 ZYRO0F11374p [Zygosaccharomyces rouxii]
MSELSSFQKKRLENIKRNNDLLKKLNLSGAANQVKKESGLDEHRPQKKKKKTAGDTNGKKSESPRAEKIPTRRSRRIRGENAEGKGVPNVNDNELLKMGSPDKELVDEVKDTRIIGDIKLSDLIKDEEESSLLDKYARVNFSSGDFFQEIKKHQKVDSDLQREFDLQPYDVFEPNDIKLVYERISAMCFHPSLDQKLIIAGDTTGNLGLWNVKEGTPDEDEEPDITRVQLFSKNVGRLDCFPSDTSKLLAASYDGFIRSIDLNTMQSTQITNLTNEYDDPLGVSDCKFSYDDLNLLHLTTLSGEFTSLDLREPSKNFNFKRLSDKKIGSMDVDPKRPYQIATGSLDRTLKIWDLRTTVDNPDWISYEDFPSLGLVSTYDSRLSVSAVSFSPTDDTLVCNGYDDTIRLFDMNNNGSQLASELQPRLTIKHNCQSGRWTSILKAKFKPNRDVFAIANMKRAIDIYDSQGQQLAHLRTATVPAVLAWHPLSNCIVGGNSSGKAFLFTNQEKQD